jgi:hypothetical protein
LYLTCSLVAIICLAFSSSGHNHKKLSGMVEFTTE